MALQAPTFGWGRTAQGGASLRDGGLLDYDCWHENGYRRLDLRLDVHWLWLATPERVFLEAHLMRSKKDRYELLQAGADWLDMRNLDVSRLRAADAASEFTAG